MARELARRGHEVDLFAFVLGEAAEQAKRLSTVRRLDAVKGRSYDLLLVNHNSCQRALGGLGPVITTCHGTTPTLEQPVEGAEHYVSISEEVADHLSDLGFDSVVIRNGIDCDEFKPVRPLPDSLGRVLLLSNYEGAVPIVRAACERLGVEFLRAGGAYARRDVARAINEADLVVTVGRGVYESLACGRNVVVFDRRDYDAIQGADGFVTGDDLPDLLRRNCSGRARGYRWSVGDVADALRMYDPRLGETHRRYALEQLNVRHQVDRYLEMGAALAA